MPPRELSEAEPPPLRTPTPPPRRRSATPELGIKCVLVGDGAVGKSSLIVSYTCNGYPACYRPTALDTFSVQVLVDGAPVRIELWDTAGQEDFDRLRSLCYPDTDVFLACFSVVQPSSFQNITEKWLPEIRTHNPQAPVLLVGTQADLRTMSIVLIQLRPGPEGPVPQPQAQGLAEKIRACCYLECSAIEHKKFFCLFEQLWRCSDGSRRSETSGTYSWLTDRPATHGPQFPTDSGHGRTLKSQGEPRLEEEALIWILCHGSRES
uniref:Rho-related GTP-binding protein RhoV n=1 Tax=Castor canadensis TaxID=51338 RepID=A0A8C0WSE2_CASCN